ncbi:MAG: ATP-grasp domain-containing protein [Bacillota bacterium]|nr:ATP-grasp domain-containing protein [Bacillota bacterium]
MKKIMVIGAGEFQVPLIKECKKQGYFVIATDMNSSAEGFKYADVALNIDTLDKELTLKNAIKYKIDGIVTTSDYPVRIVAYVCEKLNLPGLNSSAAEICTNKFLLRECLIKNKIECPKYFVINKESETENVLKNFIYPVVVKPVDSSASRGVQMVNNYEQLIKAYQEALYYSKSDSVIVEEFLEGPEFSVESLTQDGKTFIISITEKTTNGLPYFVEDRHVIPAKLTEIEEEQIKSEVIKIIPIIGINNSACHTEIKLTKNGVKVIEIGARLGGDYITSDLVPLSTGINMLENIIKISLGLKIKVDKKFNYYAGIQFINSKNYNVVSQHINNLANDASIIRYSIDTNPKDNTLKNSLDREGYYICVMKDRNDLYNKLDNYLNK